jgi:hypothetical protein
MAQIGPMNGIWEAVLVYGRMPNADERMARDGQNAYEMRVYGIYMSLTTTVEELQHVLRLIVRTQTFQDDKLFKEWLKAAVMKLVHVSDDEAQKRALPDLEEETSIRNKMNELVTAKREELTLHLAATCDLLEDLAKPLVAEMDRRRTVS